MENAIQNRFLALVKELHSEFGTDYLLFALKKISDRQMLFIDFPEVTPNFFPILKVLDLITTELETEIFSSLSNLEKHNSETVIHSILHTALRHLLREESEPSRA